MNYVSTNFLVIMDLLSILINSDEGILFHRGMLWSRVDTTNSCSVIRVFFAFYVNTDIHKVEKGKR